MCSILAAFVLLPPRPAFAQQLPLWVNDSWREKEYSRGGEWYIGFAVNDIKSGENIADATKRAEDDAKSKLAESVFVRINSDATSVTDNVRIQRGKAVSETTKEKFVQTVRSSSDVELGKIETLLHHNKAANRVYALARVKTADLADYYVSRIEFYQTDAENDFKQAKQFASSGRRGSALEKAAQAKKYFDGGKSGKYYEFLSAVDQKGDLRRLQDSRAALLREIAAFEASFREARIFVTGEASAGGNSGIDVVVNSLRTLMSDNDRLLADNEKEAGYILKLKTEIYDTKSVDMNNSIVYFCYARVTGNLINAQSGKNETSFTVLGPKGKGASNLQSAEREGYRAAVTDVWDKIKDKF
jgi:hypothetical protein